jgi:putative ABC transport system ATP-binding protein
MTELREPIIRAEHVTRRFPAIPQPVTACSDVSLEVYPGELVVLRGRSGSGKTTLLNILGGLDRPTSGSVWLGGLELATASEDQLVAARRSELGFIFQTFGLIPVLSARENIEVPLRFLGTAPDDRTARVTELLDLVDLAGHGEQRPAELSGGQQQRVAIARALAARPKILFADEPTGQLDSATALVMMDLLVDLVHHEGLAAFVTTHDPVLMSKADRVIEIHDGRVRGADDHRLTGT